MKSSTFFSSVEETKKLLKKFELLKNSNKDLNLLRGIYGEDIFKK